MQLHLFGSATPTGEFFCQQAARCYPDWPLYPYSRRSSNSYVDFTSPNSFHPVGDPSASGLWISFAPIWLFSTFLEYLSTRTPERLSGLRGVIACSSSSVITKRFAISTFDRELVARLTLAEEQLLFTCGRLGVPCMILQPTLIYGKAGRYEDRNLSRVLQLLRWLPFLPMPAQSGLRQPIHSSQLASLTLHFVQQFVSPVRDFSLPPRIAVGGDTTLTYFAMIRAIQQAQPPGDAARRCRILLLPNRLFNFLFTPLLLFSPKAFESVLRIGANLSGFASANELQDLKPQPFPIISKG